VCVCVCVCVCVDMAYAISKYTVRSPSMSAPFAVRSYQLLKTTLPLIQQGTALSV